MEERTSFEVGETASLSKTLSEADIYSFANLVGDMNPVHIDKDYASNTLFKGRIAHGMLVASLISAVLGNLLPGPGSIYLRQDLVFMAPVKPGDEITAAVKIIQWDSQLGKLTLSTDVTNEQGVKVISGEAKMIMSKFLKEK